MKYTKEVIKRRVSFDLMKKITQERKLLKALRQENQEALSHYQKSLVELHRREEQYLDNIYRYLDGIANQLLKTRARDRKKK